MPGINKKTFRRIAVAVKWVEMNPRNIAPGPETGSKGIREDRWFVTTGPMSSAAKSGADLTTYTMSPGTATARICLWDTTAQNYKPDTSTGAYDLTIYNCTVIANPIPAGKFFKCTVVNGLWEADLSTEC